MDFLQALFCKKEIAQKINSAVVLVGVVYKQYVDN
jgi:hypothetical protein